MSNYPSRVPDPQNVEELRRFWLLHAHKGRVRHDTAARSLDRSRTLLGGLAVVATAAVGTSVLAAPDETWLKIAAGVIGFAAATLTALNTFLGLGEGAEKHRGAGVEYKNLIRDIEEKSATKPDLFKSPSDDALKFFDSLKDHFAALERKAPVVPDGIYKRVDAGFAGARFVEDVNDFIAGKSRRAGMIGAVRAAVFGD